MEKISSKIKKYQKSLASYIEMLAEDRNHSLGSNKGYQPVTDFIHIEMRLLSNYAIA